jgi:hypothetical protein
MGRAESHNAQILYETALFEGALVWRLGAGQPPSTLGDDYQGIIPAKSSAQEAPQPVYQTALVTAKH